MPSQIMIRGKKVIKILLYLIVMVLSGNFIFLKFRGFKWIWAIQMCFSSLRSFLPDQSDIGV